jgi:1-aminocyclopropane-1-carboxylate deaminase/D-cysteine desulfhydrase-like pyridoxal-dependent ACC family enzyme
MLFPTSNIFLQKLSDDLFDQKQVSLSVLRLDTLHNVVSGNKLYKLHFFLKNAMEQSLPGIVTFGGAYSNHLVATAFACRHAGLKSAAIVRGERPAKLSHTLNACIEYGMELKFISRQKYDKKEDPEFAEIIQSAYKNYQVVPEGGYHPLGAAGSALIMNLVTNETSHICCAVGTATTAAGLLLGAKNNQQIITVPVLKNLLDLEQRITFLTKRVFTPEQLSIMPDYHFGGYAKKTPALLDFMNSCFLKHQLPTDFVYTGKMMFGIIDSIKRDFFPLGSKIVCIHTGGLQGNLSIQNGTLVF